MGIAEEAFERLRRIVVEGEFLERMATLGATDPIVAGPDQDVGAPVQSGGISMGEMARNIGVDPSYITALVDDPRDLARHKPDPVNRRVKIVVLTDEGRRLAEEIQAVLSVPPASFAVLTRPEMRRLSAI